MATTFPTTKLTILVELYNIDGSNTWVDVSNKVRYRDKIQIHRGLSPEDTGHLGSPDYCMLTFKNTDKRFSPRNPASPYIGYLGVNTPIRISWNAGNGLKKRFEGLIPNWNPVIPTDDIRNVRIQAYDRRQTLITGSGRKIERSPIYTSTINAPQLVTFMPLEDAANTDTPTLIKGKSVATAGVINYGQNDLLPGGGALAELTGNSYIIMNVKENFTFGGHWQFDFFYFLHNFPTADTILFRCWVTNTGSSGINFWDIIMKTGAYRVTGYDRSGVAKVDSGDVSNALFVLDTWMHHRLMMQNTSSNTFDWNLVSFPYDPSTGGFSIGGTGATGQVGNLGSVFLLPSTEKDGDATGEWAVYDAWNLSTVDNSGRAYNHEPAGTRWSRLFTEQGVSVTRRTPAWADTVAMGMQAKNSDLMSAAEECLIANEGFMDSTFSAIDSDAGGLLRFTERGYIEERPIALTLTYSNGVLYDLNANDDDFAIVNDYTASRSGGASYQVVQTRGPRNVNNRQTDLMGVGRYALAGDFSLDTDDQIPDHAGWQVNKGTVDAMRVTNCELWFERKDAVSANVLATYETLDTWNRIKIQNLPTDYGIDPFDFLIAGIDEEFDQTTLHVKVYGPPFSPYKVAILDSSGGANSDQRIDSDAARTMAAMNNSQTTVTVWDESKRLEPTQWAHDTGDYPIRILGEDMTVSAVAAITKSFVGAGALAAADNNSTFPAIHASSAKDDLMVLVMYCSNVAATIFTDNSWLQADTAGFPNFKVMYKVHSGTETGPNVLISGGSTGDACLSQIMTFRGVAPNVLGSAALTNGASATNINIPAITSQRINPCYILVGARGDDWTSVATLAYAGFTPAEAFDSPSLVGNDAGIVADYILTSGYATTMPTNSFVVTGGTSVVSQAIALAFDGNMQALTVARGANNGGVGWAHPAKQEVHVTNPLILAI
jgi:hypothetical protein